MIKKFISSCHYDANIDIYNSGDVDIIKRIQDILVNVQKDVLVLYGDTISNVDISEVLLHYNRSLKGISMTVWPLKMSYGLVEIGSDGTVESFAEKPTLDKWINIGYFYIAKNYHNLLLKNESFEEFLLQSVKEKSINAYKHHGVHITVNTISELEDAQKNIKNIILD